MPGAWLLRDGRAAAWVAVGLAIVAAFFSLGALAVAAAGKLGDELTLPAALGTYLVKVVLLGVLMVSVRGQPWLDPQALGLRCSSGRWRGPWCTPGGCGRRGSTTSIPAPAADARDEGSVACSGGGPRSGTIDAG